MIWVPLDLSLKELSNEYLYDGSIVWEGDDMIWVPLDLSH